MLYNRLTVDSGSMEHLTTVRHISNLCLRASAATEPNKIFSGWQQPDHLRWLSAGKGFIEYIP